MDLETYIRSPDSTDLQALVEAQWEFKDVVRHLQSSKYDDVPLERVHRIFSQLRAAFPIAGFVEAEDANDEVIAGFLATLNYDDDAVRLVFPVAVYARLLAEQRVAPLGSDWGPLRWRGAVLLLLLEKREDLAIHLSHVLKDLTYLFLEGSAPDTALLLCECAEKTSQGWGEADTAIAARYNILESLYDSRTRLADLQPPIGDPQRLAVATKELKFIDDVLRPAHDAYCSVLTRQGEAGGRQAQVADLAHTHRRLTWETSASFAETGAPPSESVRRWLDLACGYRDVEDKYNELGALSNALDDLEWLLSKRPSDEQLLKTANHTYEYVSRLECAIKQAPGVSTQVKLITALTRAAVLVDKKDEAARLLRDALPVLERMSDLDTETASQIAVAGEDLMGIALRLECAETPLVLSLLSAIRGRAVSKTDPSPLHTYLKLYVTRTGSTIFVVRACGIEVHHAPEAHQMGELLDDFRRLANADIKFCKNEKQVPPSDAEWRDLADRLGGRSGLHAIVNKYPISGPTLVECDGLAVHLPVTGLLLAKNPNSAPVLQTRSDRPRHDAAPVVPANKRLHLSHASPVVKHGINTLSPTSQQCLVS